MTKIDEIRVRVGRHSINEFRSAQDVADINLLLKLLDALPSPDDLDAAIEACRMARDTMRPEFNAARAALQCLRDAMKTPSSEGENNA